MENYSVYEDVATRTNGDIYVGVVGPVRTGKSTFIKRFMERLVIPAAEGADRAVMTDELPQAAEGKTVMTTEPKFVPAKAAKIKLRDGANASVRLVDCVGFAVEGAGGFEEDGAPRLIKTPWSETPMPFEEAAKLGTEKVIRDHSTIGLVMTTDGSITDLPREAYIEAEEYAVSELKRIGKPFIVLLNSKKPNKSEALRKSLEEKYGVPVSAINAEEIDEKGLLEILSKVLFEFPVTVIDVRLPDWVRTLPEDGDVVGSVMGKLREIVPEITKMRDCFALETAFGCEDKFLCSENILLDMGNGRVEIVLTPKEGLFYEVLSETCGETIDGDHALMCYVKSLSEAKRNYEKIRTAFEQAEESGYGMVAPSEDDLKLDEPKLVKRGAGYGVNFKASAPSYHVLKIDVTGEVSPIIGSQKQGEDFLKSVVSDYETSADKVWETNIFGKTLRELVSEGFVGKIDAVPVEVRKKLRRTVTRIVNEGKGGIICILL